MNPSRVSVAAGLILLAVLVVNAVALRAELTVSRVDLNDNVFHFTLIERIVQTAERGENPLDVWSPEWSLGYPVLRTYQPLAHLLVAAVYFVLGKSVPLLVVFTWMRYLSVALLPLSFFWAARRITGSPLTAAGAALLAPMVSTNFLYGIEYGSFTWAGSGLFPQAVAAHLLLLALGSAWSALGSGGRRLTVTGVLVGLTALAHLIFGYIVALSVCLLAVVPDAVTPRAVGIRRALWIGAVAAVLGSFQLLPLLLDRQTINHSRWEPVWKWDSFGAGETLRWMVTGELLDYGRLPVLSLLALVGAGLWFWRARRGKADPAHQFVVLATAFWILMLFGRPFWGPLLWMFGVSADMHLHRVIAGVHVFAVLLAAIALAALWRTLADRGRVAGAVVATLFLLYPMVRDRARNLANDDAWGRRNLALNQAAESDVRGVLAEARQRGGRAYAGLAADWGWRFKIGDVPVYAFFSTAQIPSVAFLYHSMALTGDVMVRFNERNPAHYRLFNVRTFVAPAAFAAPPFLTPRLQFGSMRIFSTPGDGYFDVVDAPVSTAVTRDNFYDVNDRWMQSDWVEKHAHLLLDWGNGAAPPGMRLRADGELPAWPLLPRPGEVRGEQQDGDVYRAEMDVVRPGYALFKMTWHRNWKAYLDGRPAPTVMLSPGFAGVAIGAGHHRLEMRYQPESWKTTLGIAGLLLVVLLGVAEARGLAARAAQWSIAAPSNPETRRRAFTAAGLLLLALPVCLPLFTSSLIRGHDAYCYFPRVEEVQENLSHGILVPRWAPDLGSGTGQPLFLMHPPMFYWLAELCHLAGFSFVTAVNLACALIVAASAFSMFLLGSLYFGAWGGWMAAASYLYVPYFATDLYVRSALEEFTAFAFFPLALYGFGAFARSGSRRRLAAGAIAYAGIVFSHLPSAMLFTPLLVGFLALTAWMEGSRRVLWGHAAGLTLGLGVAACIWLPAVVERQYVAFERAISGSANYAIHFVYLRQLLYSAWGYGYSVAGPNDGMPLTVGWSHLLLAIATCVWVARRRENKSVERQLVWFFGAAAVLLCVLMLEDSDLVWQIVKPLQFVQLPWRLLATVAVCEAVLLGALGGALATLPRLKGAAFALAMALVVIPNLSHLHPGSTSEVDPAFWTPVELARTGFETTTLGELTPRWMKAAPGFDPRVAVVASGTAQIEPLESTPFLRSVKVNALTPATIQMRIAYFPGWSVLLDGRSVTAEPSAPSGLLTFRTPSGLHRVEVRWDNTPVRLAGDAISLTSLGILLAGLRRRRQAQ
jgi:uncharacterized membrane protein